MGKLKNTQANSGIDLSIYFYFHIFQWIVKLNNYLFSFTYFTFQELWGTWWF